jgi:hypothetical protein
MRPVKVAERRIEKRKQNSFLVRYSGQPDIKGKTATFVRFATTINVSKTGLCFRSPMQFQETHRLSITNEELWDDERDGVVKWCTETKSGIYWVGVDLV